MKKDEFFSDLLHLVRRPSRYINRELNAVRKDLSKVSLTFCLAFPDVYEVGISHLGLQILYSILNNHEDIACERVYAPWRDMEVELRRRGIPLSSLESSIPLKEFDCIGFSLQYELSYTNILTILDLAGIPFFASDRGEDSPLIIGGGPMAYNPEPVAEFFDAFCIGDGEEMILDIASTLIKMKKKGMNKQDTLMELSMIGGVYIPSFFKVIYGDKGEIEDIKGLVEGYEIKRRIVKDLEKISFPTRPIIPYTQAIHDRLTVEIARGCTRGCRFCQAGMVYRPLRERSVGRVQNIIDESLRNTGYDEVSLLSLSTGDYTCIEGLVLNLLSNLRKDAVALSFPSLRVGSISPLLVDGVRQVRKTGFTIAPEAGTARLRRVINKEIDEEELIRTAETIFNAGWRSIKLYFMIGLPTEEREDLDGIIDISKRVLYAAKGRRSTVKVSVSTFVPKPHTPFQWIPQISRDEILWRQRYLRKRLGRGLDLKTHDAEMSLLEGVFARGDRRLSRVILRAYELGSRFDGWSEGFVYEIWMNAFRDLEMDIAFYAYRERRRYEVFPWDHIGGFISKDFLCREYEKALQGSVSEDCRTGRCEGCRICDFKDIKNIICEERLGANIPDLKGRIEGSKKSMSGRKEGHTAQLRSRLRINFTKRGRMRFLSHLEMVNLFYRALRRASFPLLYSRGFHPLPRVSFGMPLPVGMESLDEYVDVEVEGLPQVNFLLERLKDVMPEGIIPLGIDVIPLKAPSISASVRATTYNVFIEGRLRGRLSGKGWLQERVEYFNKVSSFFIIDDKGVELDIKPFIHEIGLTDDVIRITLLEKKGSHVRVQDALKGIFCIGKEDIPLLRIVKVRTIFDRQMEMAVS